jgi:6-phosphogluconate dehydrogenase
MQLGMIGLGRMGANMVRRLLKGGHHCVVFDRSAQAVAELVKEKAIGADRWRSLPNSSQNHAPFGSWCRSAQ